MMGVDGVLDVHDLHVAAVSSHLVTVTAHVTVTHEADGPSRDRIVHELGECACHHFPIAHSTFQLECPEHAQPRAHRALTATSSPQTARRRERSAPTAIPQIHVGGRACTARPPSSAQLR